MSNLAEKEDLIKKIHDSIKTLESAIKVTLRGVKEEQNLIKLVAEKYDLLTEILSNLKTGPQAVSLGEFGKIKKELSEFKEMQKRKSVVIKNLNKLLKEQQDEVDKLNKELDQIQKIKPESTVLKFKK